MLLKLSEMILEDLETHWNRSLFLLLAGSKEFVNMAGHIMHPYLKEAENWNYGDHSPLDYD